MPRLLCTLSNLACAKCNWTNFTRCFLYFFVSFYFQIIYSCQIFCYFVWNARKLKIKKNWYLHNYLKSKPQKKKKYILYLIYSVSGYSLYLPLVWVRRSEKGCLLGSPSSLSPAPKKEKKILIELPTQHSLTHTRSRGWFDRPITPTTKW